MALSPPIPVFENIRRSLDDLLDKATPAEERRAIVGRMRETLIHARVGLRDFQDGIERSRQRLRLEESELETVRRRKALAAGIGDQETVEVAGKYEQMHAERVDVLTRKLEAQEGEYRLAEREVEEMTAGLKAIVGGAVPPSGAVSPPGDDAMGASDAATREELDGLARARGRAEREADAQRKLDELKRRMGK